MLYKVVARNDTVVDGKAIPAGSVAVVIITDLPPGNLSSFIGFAGDLSLTTDQELSELGVEFTNGSSGPSLAQGIANESVKLPEGNLSRDVTVPPGEKTQKLKEAADNHTQENTEPNPLEGLKASIQTRLLKFDKEKLDSRESIQAYVDSGKDLLEVDGIGTGFKEEILSWLASGSESEESDDQDEEDEE